MSKVKDALAYEPDPDLEVWKPVPGYEGLYEVSNYGRVRRIFRYGRPYVSLCKPKLTKDGYFETALIHNKKAKFIRTHRLVAMAFCDNPYHKPEVNHIDGDKLNNFAGNLEWCTSSENQIHAYRLGLQKVSGGAITNRKPVRCIELDLVAASLNEMQRILCGKGYTNSTRLNALSTAMNNGTKSYKGLHFEFI
jgi:hypothetical protein